MSEDQLAEIKPAVFIGDKVIDKFIKEGLVQEWEPLRIVDTSRTAIAHMPDGKTGIVIGSGQNTQEWKNRGWKTLDINPQFSADIIVDANMLETIIMPNTQDFLLTEFLTFDKDGKNGVTPARLLQQANKGLKTGGYIVIETSAAEGFPQADVPNRDNFAELMGIHGFDAVIEVGIYHHLGEDKKEQRVVYYGKKVAEGYDESRIKPALIKPTYDIHTGKPI